MEARQINMQDSPAVQRWLESLGKQSGKEIPLDDPRVQLVKGFCEYVGRAPDEVVDYCWLRNRKDGLRSISSKRRRETSENIEEYVKQTGRAGYEATVAANTIRSFLIHNGVFMAGAAFRG
jgi:hypothetical protein